VTHPHDNPTRAELQSLDQRRADTLADALRPDAAPTGDAATMRRVVTAGDVVHEIAVEPTGQHITVRGEGMSAIYDVDPARAVLYFAALRSWDVEEIRGPGEATTAEQLATATARTEAAEQECARLRAALRYHAPKCDRCVKLATHADVERMPPHYACDHCASRLASRAWTPLYTADVLRSLDGVPR
jgi:hypothetical protein